MMRLDIQKKRWDHTDSLLPGNGAIVSFGYEEIVQLVVSFHSPNVLSC